MIFVLPIFDGVIIDGHYYEKQSGLIFKIYDRSVFLRFI